MCINAIPHKKGSVQGISPRELVTGRTVNYKRDCWAYIGVYSEASTDTIVTNDNTPCNHSCIALVTSGNRQGSVKYFDLETEKVVVRGTINQILWPERITKKDSAWGRQSKEITAKNAIQFRNLHGGKFDWDNDDLSKLEVTTELPNMIHPDMVANIPGIELESDFPRPAIPTPDKQHDIMTQLAAARLNDGLEEEPEANIDPRGVIKTTATSPCEGLDPGVMPNIEEEQEIFPELSGRYDDNSDGDIVHEEVEVEDISEPVIQRTRY